MDLIMLVKFWGFLLGFVKLYYFCFICVCVYLNFKNINGYIYVLKGVNNYF